MAKTFLEDPGQRLVRRDRRTNTRRGNGAETGEYGTEGWRPLRYFNLYRLILASLFLGLIVMGVKPRSLGSFEPILFGRVVVLYFAFAVISGLAIYWRRPNFDLQVFTQVFVDIIVITVMMYASGGVHSGFGMLVVVAVAGGSLLTAGRTAFLFAAIASIAVLFQEVYAWAYNTFPDTAYTQSGMLGATFFATAYLAHSLARRIRASEELARRRGADLANLSLLNEHIIQRMQSGILALDSRDRMRLINESAKRLLGLDGGEQDRGIQEVSPTLAKRVRDWRRGDIAVSCLVRPERSDSDIVVSFAALAGPVSGGLLLFLEDSSVVTQRAQQLKLASLGRLTASIAHEIRNPLGAISHAAQLLEEAECLREPDRRLTRIVVQQSQRVNDIIETILELSRGRHQELVDIPLGPWLTDFVRDYLHERGMNAKAVEVLPGGLELSVRMDPGQLRQILSNLFENGIRYARTEPSLRLAVGVADDSQRAYLDICDSGPGVPEKEREHLFEPFFTTSQGGTGLGLYIARELCQLNHASLHHQGKTRRGHCFRITFMHPQRQGCQVT